MQARGKPQEAVREMRALLDLLRENEARLPKVAALCAQILGHARKRLTILNPAVGEEELIEAVAAEVARLLAISRSV